MSDDERSAVGGARGLRRGAIAIAIVLGVGLGPAIAAGAAVGGAAPPVLAAALMIALSTIGTAGLLLSIVRWIAAGRRAHELRGAWEDDRLSRFASSGQRASFALAAAVLLIAAISVPLALVLHLTGPQEGPGQDVGAILVAALALVATAALIVPTIAAQSAWTWHRAPSRAEAAVLARAVPGPRRLIIAARVVTITAWTLSTAGAITTSVLLVDEAAQRLHAIDSSYSARDAAEAVRGALLDRYVVGDIRCPDSLPDPGSRSTFSCRVTSLGRTSSVEAEWFPSGFGTGDTTVDGSAGVGLVRIRDLPGPVPTAVALQDDVSAAALTAAVRSRLRDEGWSAASRAVRDLTCPSVSRDVGSDAEAGSIRCTIGTDPETQRFLDVYPVSGGRFIARTAEIADLPR